MKNTKINLTLVTKALAFIARNILCLRYRVMLKNIEILNTNKTILFLPNHQALIDPLILISNIYKYKIVLPAISSTYYDFFLFKPFFSSWGAIRVSDLEKGSRDINVLKDVSIAMLKGLNRGKNMILYPSGQISNSGLERIFNKKSAHFLVERLPENITVIGVRIRGLWGSMWSKYKTGKSPNFILQFLKGFLFVVVNLIFFLPKRQVEIEFVDITESAKKYATPGRKEFNLFLEQFYNEKGVDKQILIPYFFLKNRPFRKWNSAE